MVGRPSGWVRTAAEEFAKRIGRFADLEMIHVKEGNRQEKQLWEQSEGWWRVALDERGPSESTAGWRQEFETWERIGQTRVAWLLGGADGHGEAFRKRCERTASLGPQTLSHDLALLVWLEQLYRVESWRAGHPYHRV